MLVIKGKCVLKITILKRHVYLCVCVNVYVFPLKSF